MTEISEWWTFTFRKHRLFNLANNCINCTFKSESVYVTLFDKEETSGIYVYPDGYLSKRNRERKKKLKTIN